MSDVIRRAIIELELKLKKSQINAPELSGIKRVYEEQVKGAKQVEQQTKSSSRVIQEAAERHEEFGRKSVLAFAHAGHGALQLTRGLALLSASGQEDTQKLLESLVQIEGAVAFAKGAASLGKFAAEFGPVGAAVAGLTAIVSVGAGVWSHYRSEVAKSEEALKKVAEAQAKAGESERQQQIARQRIASQAQAASTDAELDPSRRFAALNAELTARRAARAERGQLGRNTEAVIRREEGLAALFGRRAIAAAGPRDMDQVARGGGPGFGSPASFQAEAERHAKSAEQHRQFRSQEIEADIADAEREQQLLQDRTQARLDQAKQREEAQLENVRRYVNPESPNDKAAVALATAQFQSQQLALSQQMESTGRIPSGFAYGRTFEQQQGFQISAGARNEENTIREEGSKAAKEIVEVLKEFRNTLVEFKKQVDSGNDH
jgi:hypothetical protein